MESVSLYSEENLANILANNKKYEQTPFLFLIASLSRNQAMDWASKNLKYLEKKETGSWMVYSFQK